MLVLQTMQRGSRESEPVDSDYPFSQTDVFHRPSYPAMFFVEQRYADDPTNWWIPNRACTEAMLRSSGFEIVEHPEAEVYVCRRGAAQEMAAPVHPARGE
jgi:tRNA (mo5U34)-methyltransferase